MQNSPIGQKDPYMKDLHYVYGVSPRNGKEYESLEYSQGFVDDLKDLFESEDLSEKPGTTPAFPRKPKVDIDKIAEATLSNKREILREAIQELDHEIYLRIRISRQFKGEINGKIDSLEFQLKDLGRWELGHNHSIEMRRLGLERSLLGLEKERRVQNHQVWKDVEALMRRRRDLVMAHQDLVNIMEMLGD